ncbi:39S ribosomal protein L30, mitochondrial [Daktulosphaira vitifoliae]|uniref:39S ribosomal protein L30, mitochondrial n=1 Tax=Daktulosphaira vitifoliae TaxID=58002 RepID=UPI0021AA9F1C|nr:39S ribosomal protein L30, mitochondrial [Daktulosphaira vitifoliae]
MLSVTKNILFTINNCGLPTTTFVRSLKSWTGGIKYFGFTYYPRKGEKDPPYEPTKLLMVKRVKSYSFNPYWQKKILSDMGLDHKLSDIAIVKNTPEMNARLWKVKHLIKITPIQTPDGLPEDGDYWGTHLDEEGIFRVSPKFRPDQKRLEVTNEFETLEKRVDPKTVERHCQLKWLNPWSTIV